MGVAVAEALIEDCLFQPEQLPDALESAGRLLGFDYFCLVSADLTRPAFIASEEQREGIARYFSGGWAEVDFRARTEPATPLNTLYLDHRAVGADERAASAVYNELYRPMRMANYAGIRFRLGEAEWCCSVSRAEDRGVIEGEAARDFARLAHAAMNVASLGHRLQQARTAGMREALVGSGAAAILLDGRGAVCGVTPAAEQMFGRDFTARNGVLWSANPDDAAPLGVLARMSMSAEPHVGRERVLIRGRGRRYPILITASRVQGAGLDLLSGARVLLVLSDIGRRDVALAADLTRLFDLSPAEAEVALAIFRGEDIAAIASLRGVAEATVRKQLAGVFRKLGIHRQVELVGLLARLKE